MTTTTTKTHAAITALIERVRAAAHVHHPARVGLGRLITAAHSTDDTATLRRIADDLAVMLQRCEAAA